MTGKTRKMQWMAALLLIGTAGGAMAGPGIGPYGPWNSGGGFSGFGPYQPYVARGLNVKEGLSTNYWVSRRPARLVTTTIRRAEPVAEMTCGSGLAPVAERTTTIRRTRLITSEPVNRAWVKERRIIRPAQMVSRTTTTTLSSSSDLEAVGEIITTRPARRVLLTEPACGTADHIYR